MLGLPTAGEKSWDAGFLSYTEVQRFTAHQNLSTWGWQRNTLVVIDYAASFAAELRVILSEISLSEPAHFPHERRLRILLLERHAAAEASWYSSLLPGGYDREPIRDLFDPWEPVQLHPIGEVQQRFLILKSMVEQAAIARGRKPPQLRPWNWTPASPSVSQIRNGPIH
jgi:hypothetical protein